jgi:hypothetical protein
MKQRIERSSRAMLTDLFAPERSTTASTLEEALAACESIFRYARAEIELGRIFLDDELRLSFNGVSYHLTEKAFDDLCTLLSIPVKFAKGIPTDLVEKIVNRLRDLHQETVVVIHRDEVVVGILSPQKWLRSRAKIHRPCYMPVTNLQVLQMIEKVWKNRAIQIIISDSGLKVNSISPELSVEPKVGDITKLGLTIISSETGGPMPQAKGYALRLICQNGATLPEDFGILRFSTDWRVSMDRRLEAFAEGLRNFALELERIHKAYQELVSTNLNICLFYNLYRQLRYLCRFCPDPEEKVDAALGIEREKRRELLSLAREWEAAVRRGEVIGPPPQAGISAWDIFNNLTVAGRDESDYRKRMGLERIAGNLLRVFGNGMGNAS